MTSASLPQIQVFDFSENMTDKTVYFKLMLLDGSFFVWIGTEPRLANMAVSMPPKYENTPSTSVLLGSKSEENSASLALKLEVGIVATAVRATVAPLVVVGVVAAAAVNIEVMIVVVEATVIKVVAAAAAVVVMVVVSRTVAMLQEW
ncbi:proteasome assembly chaperone 4 [Elysia marginata]|uniref:Proteasome assembly chaperone 4 n=1 Tax=Elysia marginata TaxID=1093978 RepID=A0AAV4GFE7_9GAST|nr:proteasome assembly chaperone 4 [Elysia marginata]